ncbi:MAG TPA: hypothetical protein VK753_07725 [Xanthomonadaceae bacterium]|nr:hypothetical protein [Xanthomonadaceae bacterium]
MQFDPLAMKFDPLGMQLDPLAKQFDPLGMQFDPLAMQLHPHARQPDPLRCGRGGRRSGSCHGLAGGRGIVAHTIWPTNGWIRNWPRAPT